MTITKNKIIDIGMGCAVAYWYMILVCAAIVLMPIAVVTDIILGRRS